MNHRVAKLAAAILGPATVLAAVLAGAGTASASTIGDYRGAGVEITPTRVEIHLNAMGTATQTFEVENPAPRPRSSPSGRRHSTRRTPASSPWTSPTCPGL